jgi:hypothetical protein
MAGCENFLKLSMHFLTIHPSLFIYRSPFMFYRLLFCVEGSMSQHKKIQRRKELDRQRRRRQKRLKLKAREARAGAAEKKTK